jgi:hypothetical protein
LLLFTCILILAQQSNYINSKATVADPPITWSIYNKYTQRGRVTLCPEDPSVTIPVEISLPLYDVPLVYIDPVDTYNLRGLPIKYLFSGLLPASDFKVVYNVTVGDSPNAAVNHVWLGYQRIATTSTQVNFTLTLSEEWNESLELSVHITRLSYKFSPSSDTPFFIPGGDTGDGSNQTFCLGFFVDSNSTGNVSVDIEHYQYITPSAEFVLSPGEYREIIARTVIYNTQLPPEEISFAGRFEINISCDLGENVSGLFIFYPLRHYVHLTQGGSTSASSFLFQLAIVSLLLLFFVRRFHRNHLRSRYR